MKQKNSRIISAIAVALLLASIGILAIAPAGASYNRGLAAQYIEKYALSYNPAYADFSVGGDCTNFASQMLLAGGWTETGKYSYWSDDAWYYDGGSRPWYSNSWTVVNNLYNFMSKHPERATSVTLEYPWSTKLAVGDIVQIDYQDTNKNLVPDGRWDHTYVVYRVLTGVGDDLILAAHDTDTKSEPLSNVKRRFPNAKFIGWHIKT